MKTNTKKKLQGWEQKRLSKRLNYLRSKLPTGKKSSNEIRYIRYHLRKIP